MEGGESIPVVFITDDDYVMPTSVAITSLIFNKHEETSYHIFILTDGISGDNEIKLRSLEKTGIRIELIKIDRENLPDLGQSNISPSIHVSTAATFKFLIPDLFKNYCKILYLDGDVLIKSDLTELYNTDISEVYAAAVKDMMPVVGYLIPHTKKLGINNRDYFNSGMMLLNLNLMRNDGIGEALFKYRKNELNLFMDQDAFNYVFGDRVKYIDFKFNLTYLNYKYFSFEKLRDYYGIEEPDDRVFLNSAIVLHLSSREKPWLYHDTLFSSEWNYYYERSPFKSKILNREPKSNSTLESVKVTFSYTFRHLIEHIPKRFVDLYLDIRNKLNSR